MRYVKYAKYILLYSISLILRHLVKIDDKLLVFGARGGTSFEGNPKYLFLYGHLYTDYHCVWISKNDEVVEYIRGLGYQAEYYFTLKALLMALKSRAVFITHNLTDIMPIFYNNRTKVINLWHGIPIKKIGFYDKNISAKEKILTRLKSRRTDYFISNSKWFNRIYMECFKMQGNKITALGNPRMQYLYDPTKFLGSSPNPFESGKKVFFYAPTFRDYEKEKVLEDSLLKEIDSTMQMENSHFYIKLHPLDERDINVDDYDNIFLMNHEYNTQEALQYVDVLITDYSSIIFDFLIFNKPVILYCDDLEEYKNHRDFIIDFETMFENIISRNPSEFINQLKNDQDNRVKRDVKNKIISHEVYRSCENIYALLEK